MAVLLPALASTPTHAQDAPPVNQTVDANGVDLVGGNFTVSATDVSIGPNGSHGLAYTRYWTGNDWGWRSTLDGGISGSTDEPVVTLGQGSDSFTLTNGAYVSDQANGATLVVEGGTGDYIYTDRGGVVARFMASATNGYDQSVGANVGRIRSITYPDGVIVSFTYKTETSCGTDYYGTSYCTTAIRLQSVRNNLGYMIKVAYALNTMSNPYDVYTWSTRTKATAINTAVEACDPASDSCALSQNWPAAVYTPNPSQLITKPTVVTDPVGRVWQYNYTTDYNDPNSFYDLTGIRAPGSTSDDVVVGYLYGRVRTITKAGVIWTYGFGYNASANQQTTNVYSTPTGSSRTVIADVGLGLPITDTNASNQTTTYSYDPANGRLTDVTAPEGNKVTYGYDGRGNVTSTTVTAKGGGSTLTRTAGFDSSCANPRKCNQPNWTRDAKLAQTDYAYDDPGTGLVTSITAPAPTGSSPRPQTRYGYTSVSGVTLLTGVSSCQTQASCVGSADEVKTTIGYGANLLPTTMSSGNGDPSPATIASTGFAYDYIGNLAWTSDPNGKVTETYFNAARQVTGRIGPDPDGPGPLERPAVDYYYAADGQVGHVTQGRVNPSSGAFTTHRQILYGYDTHHRKVTEKLVAPGGTYSVTQYGYDALGRPECVAVRMNPYAWNSLPGACALGTTGDAGADRISRVYYDAAGRVTRQSSAVGTADEADEARIGYTANGLPEYLTDAMGNVTLNIYDGFDRLSMRQYPAAAQGAGASNGYDHEEFGYDANGNLTITRLRDGRVINFGYDALGRRLHKSPQGVRGVAYSYDLLGRMTQAAYDYPNSPDSVTMGYDALGRRTSETTTMGGISRTVHSAYDAAGNRWRVEHPDAVRFDMSYDGLNRMQNAWWSAPGVNGYNPIPFLAISYDLQGRRQDINRASSYTGHNYDPVSRLIDRDQRFSGNVGNGGTHFDYNAAGQITSRTENNDDYTFRNHLSVDRSYATNGLNQYTSAGPASFEYDVNGNLTKSVDPQVGTTTYAYDPENRLIASSTGASLAYDPLGRLWQTSGGAFGNTQFLYDGDHVVAEYDGANGSLRRRYMWGPGADEPILLDEGGMNCSTTRFLHTDERGSVVALADCFGNRTMVNTYDEHGVPDQAYATASTPRRFGYTGQMWVPELGLWYYKARMYSPTLGRFMQTDPIGYADGMNHYNYTGSDPVNATDPSGTEVVVVGGCGYDCKSYSPDGFFGGGGSGYGGSDSGEGAGSAALPPFWNDIVVTGVRRKGRADPNVGSRSSALAAILGPETSPQNVVGDVADVVVTGIRKAKQEYDGFSDRFRSALGDLWTYLSSGSPACCFTAGTLVSTPSGLKAIETLEVGDLVMSRSDITGETAAKPIVGITPAHERRIWTVTVSYKGENGRWIDERYETTDDHPWRTADNQWVTSATLKHGQVLARENGTAIVAAVVDTKATKLTYNLAIADFHTYFVGKAETWVHNSCNPYGIPDNWSWQPGRKGGHVKLVNPSNPHDYVRIKPDGTLTQVRNGMAYDVYGNRVPLDSPGAHGITPVQFVFRP